MADELSAGAVERMFKGETEISPNPVLQVINIRKLANNNGSAQHRYRVAVSDGVHYTTAMLATQKNELVDSGALQNLALLRVTYFMVNEVSGKRIVIIINCDVLRTAPGVLGSPIDLKKQTPFSGAAPAAPAPAPIPNYSSTAAQPQTSSYNSAPSSNYAQAKSEPMNYGRAAFGGGNAAPTQRMNGTDRFIPIAALNPYQNRWTIKARVTSKSIIRRWSNARGEGHLFSVDLLDAEGGEVKGTFFKEACDKWEPVLQEGKVYTFSNGKIKLANQRYSSLKNEYEITFDSNADIRPCADESGISQQMYDFVSIGALEQRNPGDIVDIAGIVKGATECQSIMSQKLNKELFKRDLTLVDDSNVEIRLTIWGERAQADGAQWANSPAVAIKRVKVSDYGGRTLSTLGSSSIQLNPPGVAEVDKMRNWWAAGGSAAQAATISRSGGGGGGVNAPIPERRMMSAIKDEGLGAQDTQFITVKATVTMVRQGPSDPWYCACPDEENFKVIETPEGKWHCERNGKTYDRPQRRYILSMVVMDFSGNHWVTAFNNEAETLLDGATADELYEYRSKGDDNSYKDALMSAQFKQCLLRLRCKTESWNEEARLKVSIAGLQPIDYVQESRSLIEALRSGNV